MRIFSNFSELKSATGTEIGTMLAMGTPRLWIVTLFMTEALLLGLMGAAVGLAVGGRYQFVAQADGAAQVGGFRYAGQEGIGPRLHRQPVQRIGADLAAQAGAGLDRGSYDGMDKTRASRQAPGSSSGTSGLGGLLRSRNASNRAATQWRTGSATRSPSEHSSLVCGA